MRRRALLSGLVVGGLAVLSRALAFGPVLDVPLEPDDQEDEGEEPSEPPSTEPSPPLAPPSGPDDDDERPPTEPA